MKKRYSVDMVLDTHEVSEVYLKENKARQLFNEYRGRDDIIKMDLVQMTKTKDYNLKYKTLESYKKRLKEVIL